MQTHHLRSRQRPVQGQRGPGQMASLTLAAGYILNCPGRNWFWIHSKVPNGLSLCCRSFLQHFHLDRSLLSWGSLGVAKHAADREAPWKAGGNKVSRLEPDPRVWEEGIRKEEKGEAAPWIKEIHICGRGWCYIGWKPALSPEGGMAGAGELKRMQALHTAKPKMY